MDRERDIHEQHDDRADDVQPLAGEGVTGEPRTDRARRSADEPDAGDESEQRPNPPHTTTGKITAPKFGSAGSGGAELDPGYDKN